MRERRMQHPDEGTIHAWLDGALPAGEAAEVEAHVQGCAQCAGAVAEARGFIAGASRILTALDSVPSGVVPITNRRKSRNWPVWRAAAAIAVVALGSFVVLRERDGSSDQRISDLSSVPTTSTQTTTGEPPGVPTPPVGGKPQLREQRAVVPPASPSRAARVAAPRGAAAGSGDNSTTSGAQRSAAADVRESASFSVVVDHATIPVLPRDVGRRAQIGASTTLYEVAPGDTVVLTEATETRLGAMVVTGLGTAAKAPAASGARGMAKSAAADTTRAETNTRSNALSNTQSSAQLTRPVAAPPAAVNAPAAAAVAGLANVHHTITWLDSTTGKRMSLSGRHTVQELEEIRRKIVALRASPAAEKKTP
jgi:hypothetical protein